MSQDKPKIAIALSGASGRAIAHIGILEVLDEQNIPVDIITACSSATIIAASYATGTMEKLKQYLFVLSAQIILNNLKLGRQGGGLLSLEPVEKIYNEFTLHKSFEEVKPILSFVACDLNTGDPVGLNLGDMAKAARISSTVPGLFTPEKWGSKVLVDGGLFSLVPVEEAKKMGADIVIGVDIAATKYMFDRKYLNVWRAYDFVRRSLPFRILRVIINYFRNLYKKQIEKSFYSQSDFLDESYAERNPDVFFVISKALGIATQRQDEDQVPTCDLMLAPNVKHYGKMDTENAKKMYEEGRRVAFEALPEIKKIIKEYEWKNRHGKVLKKNYIENKV